MKVLVGLGQSGKEVSIVVRLTDDVGRESNIVLSAEEALVIADQLKLAVEKRADREALLRGQS